MFRTPRSDAPRSAFRLGLPQLLGLLVLVVFLPWVLLTGKSERDARHAIATYEPFAAPAFPVRFSKTMKFDSLGFMGQGIKAGFWKWTPEALELTDAGRTWFAEAGGVISAVAGAGRREMTSIQGFHDSGNRRDVRFRYRWAEINPPAKFLLSIPPRPDTEYDGKAILVRDGGAWQVERLETPDFDKPMALLKDTAEGVRR